MISYANIEQKKSMGTLYLTSNSRRRSHLTGVRWPKHTNLAVQTVIWKSLLKADSPLHICDFHFAGLLALFSYAAAW